MKLNTIAAVTHSLSDVIIQMGLEPVKQLGMGAEGVVWEVVGDKVVKFWFDDEDNSLPLWLTVFKKSLPGFPKIYSVKEIKFNPPIVIDRWPNKKLIAIVMDKAEIITKDISEEPFVVIVPPYDSLNEVLDLINLKKYDAAREITKFPEFTESLIVAHRMVIKRGYPELSPQVGVDRSGGLVLLDFI